MINNRQGYNYMFALRNMLLGAALLACMVGVVSAFAPITDNEKEKIKADLGDFFDICTTTIGKHVTFCLAERWGLDSPFAGIANTRANHPEMAATDCGESLSSIFSRHGVPGELWSSCKKVVTPQDDSWGAHFDSMYNKMEL